MTEIIQPDYVHYDIQWDKVKTIKDIKTLLQVLASKVVIDHNNSEDVIVYETLKGIIEKSDDQP